MAHPESLQLEFDEDAIKTLVMMAVWQGEKLLSFRCADPQAMTLTERQCNAPLSLVHAGALPLYAGLKFKHKEAYFRLIHNEQPQEYNCPPGYVLVDVNPAAETRSVAAMLQACYPDMQVDEDTVASWTAHPVYDPALWVWVMDMERGVPAGLGIAEIDPEVREASLEWIQVLPSCRGRGLGKMVVNELLHRVAGRVDFTTVSGRVDNVTQPERLYRRCGFNGSDVWWLLVQ